MATEQVEDLTLAAQRIGSEKRFPADQRFADGQRVHKRVLVEQRENRLEEVLLVDGLGQATVQLLRGEGLDQIIVGCKLGD